MNAPAGRPTLPVTVPTAIWVLVESLRDRQGGGKRLSVRRACHRLQLHISKDFKQLRRSFSVERLRKIHGQADRAMKDDPAQRATAVYHLDLARLRRETYIGWDSPVLWLTGPAPEVWAAMGYDVGRLKFILSKRSTCSPGDDCDLLEARAHVAAAIGSDLSVDASLVSATYSAILKCLGAART
jgi:hypothetical protein